MNATRELLASGTIGQELPRQSTSVGEALPIIGPDGERQSWLVPVTAGDRLAGYSRFRRDGKFLAYSSFQRRPGIVDGCPAAADWLDGDRIRARGETKRRADEVTGEPFLTYDRSPDRVVWAVPLRSARGSVRYVFVAGEFVYEPSDEETTA